MKRFIALVLSLVMALSLCAPAWGAETVAKIGDTGYATVEAALEAVQNGETIIIQENVTGDESGTEMDFGKAITFTITGNAPAYKMPIVTFSNDTDKIVVNIEDATLTFAELDARKNATINVKNSTIYDKGSNDIVKSYYNGAINIINSTVDTMQLTTTAYINITAGSVVNVTWQTNVYGNGLVTIDATSTLNTSAFNLTGKTYDNGNRDNTDADRVGKPAEVIVDGGELNIGCDDLYGYNVGKYGINIGTENASALTIKNGAEVNMEQYTEGTNSYAYAGEITIGTSGTVNVEDGTLNVAKSDSGTGDISLNVAGKLTVSEESSVNNGTTDEGVKIAVQDSGTLKSAGDISGKLEKTESGTIEVTGGTSGDNVADYLPESGDYTYNEETNTVVPTTFTVTFNTGDGSTVAPQTVTKGDKATKPADPTKEGFVFKGWTLNGVAYDFNTAVTGNITLVAVWEAKAPAVVPDEITSDVISEDAVKASEITFKEGYEGFNIASATDIDTIFVFSNMLVTDAAETKINAAADGATVLGDYLDINIEVYVDNTHIGYITKLPAEVEVVIPANMLPEFPSYNSSYYTREYYVIRLHDGVAMRLNAEMVNDGLSFKSKLFSTYAVAYEDVYTGGWGGYYPVVGGTTTTPDADETVTSPKTFDAGVALYVGMSVAAAVGTVTLSKKRED